MTLSTDGQQDASRARSSLEWLLRRITKFWLIILFLVAWQFLSKVAAKPVQFPPLTDVGAAIATLLKNGSLFVDMWASLSRILVGYAIGAAVGIPLGIAMGLFKRVEWLFDPPIEFLRPISSIAWIPLFLSLLGIGDQIAISVVIYASIFPITINTLAGVRQVKKEHIQSALTLGASRWLIVKDVIIPGALPLIFTGLRIAYGTAWMGIVAAELVGTSSGLGFMITHYQRLFYSGGIVAGMFAIAFFGLLGDKLFQVLQAYLTPWSEKGQTT